MPSSEHYYHTGKRTSFLRHSTLDPQRKTLLFLHGIGDSSLSYLPFLQTPAFKDFNILIPDWLGYGKSSASDDYHFKTQVTLLLEHLQALAHERRFTAEEIILVPHSMSGIHAMLLCDSPLKNQIKGVINVEGSLTQYGSFIANKVSRVIARGQFESWFEAFKQTVILKSFVSQFPECRTYYDALNLCQPQAFLQNALEIHQVCLSESGPYTNRAGNVFAKLPLPKVYCYGDQSLCKESLDFLQQHAIPTHAFHTANHFVMLACLEEFIHFIKRWIKYRIHPI